MTQMNRGVKADEGYVPEALGLGLVYYEWQSSDRRDTYYEEMKGGVI